MENKKIKNIIFDLGGVIIDLNPSKTIGAFSELSGKREDEILKIAEDPLFKQYEKGEVESDEFRSGLNDLFELNLNSEVIDNAWNAMLGDTPLHRLHWLSSLNKKYRVFILSNTNYIHVDYFHNYLTIHHAVSDFSNHVEKAYYSQLMGMRKPDREIFDFVIEENNLEPDRTLFLDDNSDNLKGANECGINTIQINHPEDVPQLLLNAGIKI